MRLPNLKDVFYELFCKDEYAASDHNRKRFCDLLAVAEAKYNISFHDNEELYTSFVDCALEEQYMGFLRGFSWAVLLLTGKAPNINDENNSD